MNELYNYFEYSKLFHKIVTKKGDVLPFILRQYQKEFVNLILSIEGPKRIIVLKPRQAGFTTICSSFFMWLMATRFNFRGIGLADQHDRTMEMQGIYSNFLLNLDPKMKPQIKLNNSERMVLDNPEMGKPGQAPGLGSSIKYGTARDKNAGRAGARLFGHLTEAAFYLYPDDIDEGIQNSIPLDDESLIIKESTANGRQGIGGPFYELWLAAEAGDSLYKPFFVAWYQVDDYFKQIPKDFELTAAEKDIVKLEPRVKLENLVWRRLKISEYRKDVTKNEHAMPPEERFKQDFPLTPEEAFRSSGRPVFDQAMIQYRTQTLRNIKMQNIAAHIKTKNHVLQNRMQEITILSPPRDGKQYFLGADVAEGLEDGDSSTFYVIDEQLNDVAFWAGKIDPDLFGHLLVGIGDLFNHALLVIEKNNMGISTVTAAKNEGYPNIYRKVIEDKLKKEKRTEYGWRTTELSKMEMMNNMIALFRDEDWKPRWLQLVTEMGLLSREADGNVTLNSMDRTVSAGLALIGWRQTWRPEERKSKKSSAHYDTYTEKKRTDEIFD